MKAFNVKLKKKKHNSEVLIILKSFKDVRNERSCSQSMSPLSKY